ncbi:MAG: hypothetical protein KI790_00195 [Cyclobacteriaceae bacterium]|nr:hypothetical protein [Cyclobacteriaceae bacterium HetDA_MAG_MS6]
MKHFNLAIALLLSAAFFSGCTLQKMVKLAADQDLQVDPNPLEVHGGKVPFAVSAVLPPKMLPKGKVYTLTTIYKYGDQSVEVGSVEFKADDFPNSSTSPSRKSEDFSFNYQDGMNPGKLFLKGTAKDPRNGKTLDGPEMEVAPGLIVTSMAVKDVYLASFADHGYNDQEELIPTNVNFFFPQGSSVLSSGLKVDGETNRAKQSNLSAFIAEKNVTKTVTITGTHSPEGSERINSGLSNDRAKRIESYYRKQMRRYDYKGLADSIEFILKPVVEDWAAFKAALREYEGVSDDAKSQMTRIVDGTGTFEDKEKQLQKIDGYKKVFDDLYPGLRSAKTEILTVKPKKSAAEIAVLSKLIVSGDAKPDTLSDEEFLYSATLTPSLEEKEAIYMAATKRGGSWIAHNNLAAAYLAKAKAGEGDKNKLVEDALTQLEIAANKNKTAEVAANMGSGYLMQGEYSKAYEALGEAESLSPSNNLKAEINGLKGAIEIRMGEYDKAKASFANAKSADKVNFDRGLVNLLSKDYAAANTGFDGATDGTIAADAYYYKAVTAARSGNASDVISNLKEAVAKDSDLKDKALNDLEFVNFADAVGQAIR